MSINHQVVIGDWFRNLDGKIFKVVAINDSEDTIDIQYFDGDLAELDSDEWNQLALESIDAPEDWSGPYDNLVLDDFGDTDAAIHPETWVSPLSEIENKDY